MSRLIAEAVRGERGLRTVDERAAEFAVLPDRNGLEGRISEAIRGELEGLAKFFESEAQRIEKMYRDISMDGERETRSLREVAAVLRARATGDLMG